MISQLGHFSCLFCFPGPANDLELAGARLPRGCRSAVPATACAFAAGTINVASGPGGAKGNAKIWWSKDVWNVLKCTELGISIVIGVAQNGWFIREILLMLATD